MRSSATSNVAGSPSTISCGGGPVGAITSLGLASSYLFLADALERIGLQADFVRISPYKTAVDTLARSEMSQEAREMANWLLDDIYSDLIKAIAQGRKMDESEAEGLIDNSPYTDAQVLDARAIDGILEEEDLPRRLGADNRPARLLSYERARKRLLRPPLTRPGRYVAIIRVEGMIVDGRSARPPAKPPVKAPFLFSNRAGDLTVVEQVRRATREKRVAAVVLHVDSGGGSATASEAMAAALRRLAAEKPLVVSMSTVAASGGYYVATPADWIVAEGSTITGSIGVLSGKLVNAGMFGRLMFNRELISRGAHAAISHPGRPYSEEEKKIVWNGISRMYDVFLDRVSTGRKLAKRRSLRSAEAASGPAGRRLSTAWSTNSADWRPPPGRRANWQGSPCVRLYARSGCKRGASRHYRPQKQG